jgi:hypothetical protein
MKGRRIWPEYFPSVATRNDGREYSGHDDPQEVPALTTKMAGRNLCNAVYGMGLVGPKNPKQFA